MKLFLQFILKYISKFILWRYAPVIIAITGSVGKTSARDAVFTLILKRFMVRKSVKNYNNEIGVPMSVIGSGGGKLTIFEYLNVIFSGIFLFFWKNNNFPRFLVLEMGVDKQGDIKNLTDIVRPNISVVTAIGEMPAHIEFFPERDALIEEKMQLLMALPENGVAVLNYDDLSVRDMRYSLSENISILTYGFGSGAVVKGDNYAIGGIEDKNNLDTNLYMSFKIAYNGSTVPVRICGLLGYSQAYAVLAAASIAIALGMNLLEITEGIGDYISPPGRTKLLKGIKKSWIIDDSYNSSPLAAISAIETLAIFKDYRKIAILGDMLELGEYTEKAHCNLGVKAAEVCDFIIAVGLRAKFIYDEALSRGFNKENIFYFDQHQVEEAGKFLQKKINSGDMILIKGSQEMRMEKIVKEIMAEPEKAKELLVRQDYKDA
ncbi:MAG: Mur ligase family protein [Patescibacteria group bacterium]